MADEKIVITVIGEDGVSKVLVEISKSTEKLDKNVSKASKTIDAMNVALGNLAADALKMAVTAVKDFVVGSIDLASSAQETASLIENSLGPAAQGFTEDLGALAAATNRSQVELESGVASIIAMTRSMGFGQQAAADFSVTMAQIAVDLGSFFNQSTEQVFQDLQSALAGSSETMLKYGIDVKETQLKNAALEMGLISQGETLDRVTRATVLQAEVLRQAADAMGDAERTSDSYENTQRGLDAALLDLQITIGEALIPVMTELAQEAIPAVKQAAEDATPALEDFGKFLTDTFADITTANRVKSLTNELQEAGVSLKNLGAISRPTALSFGELVKAFINTEDRIKQQRREIDTLEIAMRALELGIDANSDAFVDYVLAQVETIEKSKALNEANKDLIDSEFNLEEAITGYKDIVEVIIPLTGEQTESIRAAKQETGAYELSVDQLKGAFERLQAPLGNYYTAADQARGITKDARDAIEDMKVSLFGVEPAADEASAAFGRAGYEIYLQAVEAQEAVEALNDELDQLNGVYEAEIRTPGLDEGLSKARELANILRAIAGELPGGELPTIPSGATGGGGSPYDPGGSPAGGNIGPPRQHGGYTGNKMGLYHPGEYIFSPSAVNEIGVPALEAMHQSAKQGLTMNDIGSPFADYGSRSTGIGWTKNFYLTVNSNRSTESIQQDFKIMEAAELA